MGVICFGGCLGVFLFSLESFAVSYQTFLSLFLMFFVFDLLLG